MPVDPVRRKAHRQDAGSLLAGQIGAMTGDRASVTLKRERPWASITFAGTRHSLVVDWPGATGPGDMENLAKALPDHEFAIPGHFVADILVLEQSESRLVVEALSIIDPVENFRH